MRVIKRASGRVRAVGSVGLLAGAVLLVPMAPQANASCLASGGQGAIPGTSSVVGLKSNVYSQWLTGPGTISRSITTTDTATYTLSGSYSFTVSDLISSANATFGVSVAKASSKSSTWTYTLNVPSGETARAMVWKRALHFEVGTYNYDGSCNIMWSNKAWMNAPYSSTDNSNYLNKLDISPGHTTTTWG